MPKPKRERSRGSPAYPLADVLDSLQKVKGKLGSGPYGREAVAEALGMSPGSGTANSKCAAMVHFGLLVRQRGAYHLSALAERILHPTSPEEEALAVADAACSPALFAELVERFGGNSIPSLLANVLAREYGIVSKQSAEVAKTFRESMERAGLLRNGILMRPPGTDEEAVPVESAGHAPPVEPRAIEGAQAAASQRPSTTPRSGDSANQYRVPLKRGREAVLELPRPLHPTDVERIQKWLTLMEEVLTEEPSNTEQDQ